MDDINIPLNSNNLNGEVILPKKKGGMIVWGLVTLLLVVTAVFATLIISAKVASKTPVAPTAPESSPKAFEPITEEIFTTEEVDQEVPEAEQLNVHMHHIKIDI